MDRNDDYNDRLKSQQVYLSYLEKTIDERNEVISRLHQELETADAFYKVKCKEQKLERKVSARLVARIKYLEDRLARYEAESNNPTILITPGL